MTPKQKKNSGENMRNQLKSHLRAVWCAFTVAILILAGGLSARAFTNANADTMMNAFNTAYYQPFGSGLAHYKDNQTGGVSYFWTQAEMIETLEDAYDRTGSATYKSQISALLNGFSSDNGTNWSGNNFNDDITWACLAYLRGYQITGNTTFRTIAKANFDMMYARAWDTVAGGLWWDVPKGGKNIANNGPAVIAAYMISQIFGDSTYLTKAQNIYNWEKAHLFDANSGAAWASVSAGGVLNNYSTAATQGLFVGDADLMGDTVNATKAMNYAMNTVSIAAGGIMSQSDENGLGIRWMAKYMKNRGLQSTYLGWLQFNANIIWANRRVTDNFSWQVWGVPTDKTANFLSWQCFCSVMALQDVPADNAVLNVYTFTNIGNPGTCLQGTGDSYLNGSGQSISVVNEVAATPSSWNFPQQQWTLLPAGSGTSYLMNTSSGQFLQSTGDPYHTHGGANVPNTNKVAITPPTRNSQQLWSLLASGSGVNLFNPANNQHVRATGDAYWSNATQAYVSGGYQTAGVPHASVSSQDQWNMVLPTGNYQIVARSTGTALDCTGGGTGNGTLIELWTSLNNSYQTWRITYLNNGYYSIINPNSGRSLDCTGYTGNDGTQIELWDYSGNPGQQWKFTLRADGGYTISPALTNANGVNDVLDGSGCSGNPGTKVILWPWGGGGSCQQEWNIVPM
jgi:hypothetical protein